MFCYYFELNQHLNIVSALPVKARPDAYSCSRKLKKTIYYYISAWLNDNQLHFWGDLLSHQNKNKDSEQPEDITHFFMWMLF